MLYTAEVQAALSIRKARTAEYLAMQPAQRASVDQENDRLQQITHLHRVRARAAYMRARPAPRRRRCFAQPPKESRQYVAMATTAVRDARLSKTTITLVAEVVALAGRAGHTDVTNEVLGQLINRSRSTVKRCVREAVEFGYLTSEIVCNARGSVTHRRLTPTDQAWPFWHPKSQKPQGICGATTAPDITNPLKGESIDPENQGAAHRKIRQRRRRDSG